VNETKKHVEQRVNSIDPYYLPGWKRKTCQFSGFGSFAKFKDPVDKMPFYYELKFSEEYYK